MQAKIPGLETEASSAVLGTMTFGDTVDIDGARQMIRAARDAGVTVIDTANGYAGGDTERMLGDLGSEIPSEMIVCTKAGIPHPDADGHAPLSPTGIQRALDGSLSRLRRPSVDLFYLHQPDRSTPIEETLSTVKQLLQDGQIRAWGVSNFAAWQIADLDAAADRLGMPGPVVAQQLYSPIARRLEDEYVEFAASHRVHTMVYNPLGGGLLSGKHDFTRGPQESGRFSSSRLAQMYRDRYWNERLFDGVARLEGVAAESGLPLLELALRWVLSRDVTGSVLLGGSKVHHLTSNLDALARGPLSPDLVAACDEATASLSGAMPAYNR